MPHPLLACASGHRAGVRSRDCVRKPLEVRPAPEIFISKEHGQTQPTDMFEAGNIRFGRDGAYKERRRRPGDLCPLDVWSKVAFTGKKPELVPDRFWQRAPLLAQVRKQEPPDQLGHDGHRRSAGVDLRADRTKGASPMTSAPLGSGIVADLTSMVIAACSSGAEEAPSRWDEEGVATDSRWPSLRCSRQPGCRRSDYRETVGEDAAAGPSPPAHRLECDQKAVPPPVSCHFGTASSDANTRCSRRPQ